MTKEGTKTQVSPMAKKAVEKIKSQQKRDDPKQSRAFIEKAREIGADEEKSAADAMMGRLAKTPPDPRTKDTVK